MKQHSLLSGSISLAFASVIALLPNAAYATSTVAGLISPNPAAPGFLTEESDADAIRVADKVMHQMGGRPALDATRVVTWKFFGNRFHVWDRHTGDVRIEGADRETKEPYLILMNIHSKEGRAWKAGEEVTDAEKLAEALELGESAWINDSYWLFMPYKLKDTGVALKHLGERAMRDGGLADVLELTFRDVGKTPENRYEVYVGKDSGLVEQWDFFTNASDEEPRFQVPWRNWRRHGSILLSDDRGRGQHTDIAVFDTVPESVFTSPEPVDLAALEPAGGGAGPEEAPIYAVEGDVMKPVRTEFVMPEYTLAAREARTEGIVVVRTVIARDGTIRDAWVTEPLDDGLDQQALEAIRKWKFEPATLDGEPVEIYYNLTVNFRLEKDAKDSSD